MAQVARHTIQYVNPPKAGKKWGSIKTADGTYFSGPPEVCNKFTPGEVCDIAWEPFGNDGKKVVKKMEGSVPGAVLSPDASPWDSENPAPRPAPAHVAPPKANGYALAKCPAESEQMWTNAILQRFIELGQVPLETVALAQATAVIRDAYRLTFGKKE